MIQLANFAMRSRWNAVLAALALSFAPLLSFLASAIVALVTLRKGANEGALVLAVSLLPALMFGDGIMLSNYGMIIAVYAAALALRQTVSLLNSITVAALASAGLILGILGFAAESLLPIEQVLADSLSVQQSQLTVDEINQMAHLFTIQALGVGFFLSIIASLFLGRWWQACLYNPGGFQQEFHQLRMQPLYVTTLFVLAFLASQMSVDQASVSVLALLPIMMAALGLVHYLVKVNQTNVAWLILFYVSILVMSAFGMIMLLLIGIADSLFNFRQKYQQDA